VLITVSEAARHLDTYIPMRSTAGLPKGELEGCVRSSDCFGISLS
jgi:hypothetical protein